MVKYMQNLFYSIFYIKKNGPKKVEICLKNTNVIDVFLYLIKSII